jgi:hypothetical protein
MEQSLVSRSNATERAKSAVSAYLLCLVAGLAGCQHQAKPADQASASREQPRNGGAAVPEDVGAPSERKFRFFYAATINELPPEAAARIWLPLPPTNHEQTIKIENIQAPGKVQRTTESRFGNNLLYLEAQADVRGEIPLEVTYLVTRRGVSLEGAPAGGTSREQFLTGSSLVPANGKVLKRFFSDEPPRGTTLDVARALYDRVELHMKYDKSGEGWGRGDALWACDSQRGNCTDFHSVFIALCRDMHIPARFEIGFLLPSDRERGEIAGYHCWAQFLDRQRWIGVDISAADQHPERKDFFFGHLPPDRVMFSMERDLELAPPQTGGPVNFLIYPYVEVDGKPYPNQRRSFAFEDVQK